MKQIVIRTLGGKGIGYGHFYRCLSLARAFKQESQNINIIFLVNEELVSLLEDMNFEVIISNQLNEDFKIIDKLNIDLFIFDSYLGNNNYLRKIKEHTKLMLIDDNNDIYDSSIPDIIYNGNIHAEKLKYKKTIDQLRLLGSKYLIMREEYWDSGQDKAIIKDGILITTGGTDEYEIMHEIMDVVKDLEEDIKLIIGPGYTEEYIKKIKSQKTENMELVYKPDSLKKYIDSSSIVITAGGSTVYEILTMNSIPIIFSLADNQDLICRELENLGIGYLGKYPKIKYEQIIREIEIKKDLELSGFNNQINLLDGKGASITASKIIKSLNNL